jgi:hypothetical protein
MSKQNNVVIAMIEKKINELLKIVEGMNDL